MNAEEREEAHQAEQAEILQLAGRMFGLTQPKTYENDKWLYEQLVKFSKDNVDLEDPRHHSLIASCILHSYRVRENRTTPYLFLTGPPSTGKNRILHILRALCYRGWFSGENSAAAIYQTMDLYHPTLCIDEAEKLAPYRKTMSDGAQAILSVLNSGYCQDQPVTRGTNEGRIPKVYDVFGFKAIASTETLPDTVLSRCIVIACEQNVNRNIPVSFDPKSQRVLELKSFLEMYAVQHDPQSPYLKSKEKEPSFDIEDLKQLINNYRVIELFGPLYKNTPDPLGKKDILDLAYESDEDRKEETGSGEDGQILETLLKIREGTPSQERYTITAITKLYNEGRESWEIRSNDWMGKKLRKFGLRPCRGTGGLRGIRWSEKKLRRKFERYGLVSPQGILSVTSVPETPLKSDTLTLSDTSTSTQVMSNIVRKPYKCPSCREDFPSYQDSLGHKCERTLSPGYLPYSGNPGKEQP